MSSDIHSLSGAYAVDALDPVERADFEAHLAECADCRAEVRSLRETTALLAAEVEVTPPPAMRANVLAQISRIRPLPPEVEGSLPQPVVAESVVPEPVVPEPVVPEPATEVSAEQPASVTPLRPRRWWQPTMLVAAVLVLIVAVVGVWRPWADDSLSAADRVLAAADAQKVTLELDGATATVVRSKSEHRAVIVTENMPDAPAGQDYQLWLQTPADDMVSAGVMPARENQTVLLDGDATDAIGVGITVEPDGGSPAPTSDPIALFDLT